MVNRPRGLQNRPRGLQNRPRGFIDLLLRSSEK
nr:MAG TPA: hypothetical protein [Caudoviricetes sp.]DAQ24998.1 MAG TPA: hypothetical protein [Bacteriophage sp.]